MRGFQKASDIGQAASPLNQTNSQSPATHAASCPSCQVLGSQKQSHRRSVGVGQSPRANHPLIGRVHQRIQRKANRSNPSHSPKPAKECPNSGLATTPNQYCFRAIHQNGPYPFHLAPNGCAHFQRPSALCRPSCARTMRERGSKTAACPYASNEGSCAYVATA